ncbi:conjugal transfer protein TrbE [Legionella geestiana]|uniref:Conjugal transfer protein TrbE n=1 Tax=Legionella geestiana TaxID=45065 RepID=A0A0W0U397_9GAMM|nr:conjugal transfer protein TrbE [Legionella geestiana]KTD02109.1 conjugal transfer protein TrbE [Legionella geestiana]QBS11545.1 conjugal transfer protein TrbE [Legionella geestiana]STX53783.1 Conjugal transfer protein trbE precursor [Legionella geestiana]
MMLLTTALFSLFALSLLSVLLWQVRIASRDVALKRHRQTQAGFVDLLNYAAVVDDGVVIGKNGAFMAAWRFFGTDAMGSTDAAREMVAFRINQALAGLGSGWMVHVDAKRKAAPHYSERRLSHFPDKVSAAVDEERRRLFESAGTRFESEFVLTLTWFPPVIAQQRFVELMFEDAAQKVSRKAQTRQLMAEFSRHCANIESRLSLAFILQRLKAEETVLPDGQVALCEAFLEHLQYCATGIHQPVLLPKHPIYLDALLAGQELWGGVVPKIGRHYVQCIAIEGFPGESYPGILGALSEVAVAYRFSTRFIFMDTHEALAHLDKFRKKWKQKVRGFFDQVFNTSSGVVDEDALNMVQDAAAAMAETNSGLVAQGYYTAVIVLMHESREALAHSARFLEKTVQSLGFSARIETINTLDAWLGSLPGHGVENVRRPLLNTMNLADLLPTSSIWSGENRAPCPLFPEHAPPLMHCVTSGNTPFRLNLHVRDLGHTIVFGPTRSGKSTHLAMIALQWRRYQHARIYAFDKGLSMYVTCRATGGAHYTIGGNTELAFAPLQFLATRSDQAWAMEWIDTILALNGLDTTPNQRNESAKAIAAMHQSGSKTLSDFTLLIQDEAIRETLRQYTIDGLMGHLLDAEDDALGLSDFMTFEIEHLMALGEKFALPVLLYLFRRIEQSLDGKPTLIILDEAWLMLAHPVFRKKIAEWLDSMAKKNCTVLMATQHLSHAANSGILDVIVESTATRIFLPNLHAKDPEAAKVYGQMGLNPRQIDLIANARPKQDYFLVSDAGCRLYELSLGRLALAFAGATDLDSIEAIKKLEARHGDDWVVPWCEQKGLSLNDYGVSA